MVSEHPSDFDCPKCGAKYRVVGVETPSNPEEAHVFCRSCQGPLEARYKQFLLKYFLVERPGERGRFVQ